MFITQVLGPEVIVAHMYIHNLHLLLLMIIMIIRIIMIIMIIMINDNNNS